jgi:hypothetical protein
MKDRPIITRVRTFNVEKFHAARNRMFKRVLFIVFAMFITIEVGYHMADLLGILEGLK